MGDRTTDHRPRTTDDRRSVVVIVAKRPDPGQVKTRLCPPLTYRVAAELAYTFFEDTLAVVRRVRPADTAIGYSPGSALSWFKPYAPTALIQQGPGDLGERMSRLFDSAFDRRYGRVVLIGTDTPHLGPGRLEAALEALTNPGTVVLGPAMDGGYYLIGLSAPCPALFEGIAWSTDTVFAETLYRADALGLRAEILPLERDIDTPEDLAWLTKELARLPATSATARLLRRLSPRSAPHSASSPESSDTPPPAEAPC